MKVHMKNHQAGFTLIEFIVGLVIAAIMASMIYSYFGSALTQSSAPILRFQKASDLHTVMEKIVTDNNRINNLNERYKWRSSTAYSIGDMVNPSDKIDNITSVIQNNGRYYICTQAGTSDSTNLPGWTITTPPGTEFNDGTVKWREWGYVWKANMAYPANAIVVPKISNGHYYTPSTAGTSGATDPATTTGWPKTNGGSVSDGVLTWMEVGTTLNSNTVTDNIFKYLTTNPGRYGSGYNVVSAETKFIQFDSSNNQVNPGVNSTPNEDNILKVTIKSNSSGETLTTLFTTR
jgi:prepilin-type N-terminal cleavage/methylation domain-containing protein